MNEAIDLSKDEDPEIIEVRDDSEKSVDELDEEAEAEERKRRRRRLKLLLNPSITPSFIAIISPDYENHLPKRIRVDINEHLGLCKKPKLTLKLSPRPIAAPSSQVSTLPKEEGYYEGVTPVALPDDDKYMNELHLLIRLHLEIFSATDEDVKTTQAGRRTPTVRGKVGIRCIHCAKVALSHPISTRFWPPGSVSYPINVEGLYSVCTQKPKLHFEICPYMPQEIKGQLYRLTHDAGGNSTGRQTLNNMSHSAISAVNYYLIAAKRIGLVNVPGGIRFGRDLNLEPLSVESVRIEVEAKASAGKKSSYPSPLQAVSLDQPRIAADDSAEKVLAEAIAEKDNDRIVGRSDDSKLVTDFIFLCVRQMAICHCVPADFESRGKKTALMRIGFAGFCCRHCSDINNPETATMVVDFSCRSFTSAADNLSSAITGSFYGHIQKCYMVPIEIRKALAAYKRIHSRQITRLPHGSQRRLFHAIWARLRAADLSKEEMQERLKKLPFKQIPARPIVEEKQEEAIEESKTPTVDPVPSSASVPDAVPSELSGVDQHVPCYPPCEDEETARLLKALEDDHDYSANDNLFLPKDRPLVTDYVFFMMKNMRVAVPNSSDFSNGRRTTVLNTRLAGFACKHCHGQDALVAAAGRSFPSQPDNMASSLNTTFYNHMQRCYHVPDNIKRAVANLKRLHSQQCSNLRFGSQRKFFNRVYERLKAVDIPKIDAQNEPVVEFGCSRVSVDNKLTEFGFFRISPELVECSRCRLIPLSFRAPDAVSTSAVSFDQLSSHRSSCQGRGYYLGNIIGALSNIMEMIPSVTNEVLQRDTYKAIVQELVGDELLGLFTSEVLQRVRRKPSDQVDSTEAATAITQHIKSDVDFDRVATLFELWAKEVEGVETTLRSNKFFLGYFQLLSPSFMVPTQVLTQASDDAGT